MATVALAAAVRGSWGEVGAIIARGGWVLVVAVLVQPLVAALRPITGASADAPPRSAVARRYRG